MMKHQKIYLIQKFLQNLLKLLFDQKFLYPLPLAESFGYANDLRSITQGRAGYSMEFDRYLEAPESVVEAQAT